MAYYTIYRWPRVAKEKQLIGCSYAVSSLSADMSLESGAGELKCRRFLLSSTKSTPRIKSVVNMMDPNTAGFLGSIQKSRLDKLLLEVSDCCSSPTPVTILEVKGQKPSKLRGRQSNQICSSLADLGTVGLLEELDEKELSKYFESSRSTASEAEANETAKPTSLRIL